MLKECEPDGGNNVFTEERWRAIEGSFFDLGDTDAPVGGCESVELTPYRVVLGANLSPLESSSSYALVSRLIAGITPTEEVGARSATLLRRYKDLEGIMRAAESDFRDEEIITDEERLVLRTVRDVSVNLLRKRAFTNRKVACFADLYDYLKLSLATERQEVTRLLFLNGQSHLIADELHSRGSLNQTPLFPRQVISRAVVHNAAALIIVHNHPSGEPEPSRSDIKMSQRLASILREIGVELYDHLIVGQRVVASFRKLGLLEEGER